MYRTDFGTLWEKAGVGCSERIALKQVYYQGWNRPPAHIGCMRQVLMAGALGRPRGMGWEGRREGGLGWGAHVNPWLIHVNVWQKPLQYCKVISLQLIKINFKKKKRSLHGAGEWMVKQPQGMLACCSYWNSVLKYSLSCWKLIVSIQSQKNLILTVFVLFCLPDFYCFYRGENFQRSYATIFGIFGRVITPCYL